MLFSTASASFHIPTSERKHSDFPRSSPALDIFWFLENGHPNGCEVIPCGGFDLNFLDDK